MCYFWAPCVGSRDFCGRTTKACHFALQLLLSAEGSLQVIPTAAAKNTVPERKRLQLQPKLGRQPCSRMEEYRKCKVL